MSTVIRKWLKCVLVFSFVCGVVIPLSLFIVTNGYDDLDSNRSPFMIRMQGFEGKLYSHERKPLDYPEAQASNHEEVRYQMQELQRIVVSVRNELRQLEQERNQVRKDVDKSKSTLSKLRKEAGAAKSSLQDSKAKLAKTLREMKRVNHYEGETQMNKSPVVVVNLPRDQDVPIPRKEERNLLKGEKSVSSDCFDAVCFDYSRCPLTNPFSVYVYNQHQPDHFGLKHPDIVEDLLSSLQLKHSLTTDPNLACIFIVITGPLRTSNEDPPLLQQKLESLPHWNGGRNHVIVDLSDSLDGAVTVHGPLAASISARSYASNDNQKGYNILLPPVTSFRTDEPPLGKLPLFLPGFRQFLFLFEGVLDEGETRSLPTGRTHISGRQLALVKEAISSNTKDKVVINTECNGAKELGEKFDSQDHHAEHLGEWLLCGVAHDRALSLSQATFSLILGSTSGTLGPVSYTRLVEGLRYGAIPVVLGVRHLPFDSVIDWKRAAVMLPVTSLGQLHYVLKNLPTDSILEYRRQGRFLWETYFSSPVAIMDTVVAILRQRAHHPPPAATSYAAETNLASIPGDNFILPSREFLYNFTYSSDEFWNSPPGPFYMYPTTPFKPAPVSGSQYVNLDVKHISNLPQHVVAAGGITGPFFEDYLLGNYPEEQFTVVMLTYERNEVLVEALKRLRDLDHLAKVVVVWNGLEPPPDGMSWPELGVPLEVGWVVLSMSCRVMDLMCVPVGSECWKKQSQQSIPPFL